MDAYGHINNVVFLRYLEEARIDFMFRPDGKDFQQGSVVARHEIDYKQQLVHRHQPVDIELWVTQIRAASFTIAYEVKDPDQVYVRAADGHSAVRLRGAAAAPYHRRGAGVPRGVRGRRGRPAGAVAA